MLQWIVLFVVVDAIIVAGVLVWVRHRRQARAQVAPGPDMAQIARFAKDVEPELRDYMAGSYDGDPATLATVLPGLVSRIHHRAQIAGVTLPREALEGLVARGLASLDIARERDVHRALEDARGPRDR